MEAYKNPALSPRERAKDLLGRMTLYEKAGQLNQRLYGFRIYERNGEEFTLTDEIKDEVERMGGLGVLYGLYRADPWADKDETNGITPELAKKAYNLVQDYVISHSRLGIPVLMSSECPHGHQALGGGLLPVNLAAGATFDPELLRKGYSACGRQLRSGHVDLALMSVLDVLRDPRWGRSEECYSEDPYLCSRMAKAAVEGMQSQQVGCVAKHFCAQGETTGGINASAARIGERELREIHFPAAKACCEAGVEGVMAAYNEIDGIYCHGNPWLLRTVLREEMGFGGIVMADGVAIDYLKNTEGDTLHAGAAALKAGVDVSLWDEGFSRLPEAVEKGLVEESVLDEAVLRVLELKFKRGLFEHPFMEENMETAEEAGVMPISLELARESAVLLKNQNVLPLEKPVQKIAVIGYHAADRYCMLGDYTPPVPEEECVTIWQGMKKLAPAGVSVKYAMGSGFTNRDDAELARAVALAKESDVIVAVVGGSSSRFEGAAFDTNGAVLKGSTSRTMDCGEGMDLSDPHIPAAQEELIRVLAELGKPMVTVVIAGRPYCIGEVEEQSNALLYSFYPGPMGGLAIAEILYGITGPSGRLPASLPRNVGQLPVAYNYSASSAAIYSDGSAKPLHSFGEGMSYTKFSCDKVELMENGDPGITLSFTLKNEGTRKGTAVPSLYVRRLSGCAVPRVRELKGFCRVELQPGEEKRVEISVTLEEMDVVMVPGRAYVPCRNYILMLSDGQEEYWCGEYRPKD
ncbi:MAG: glycoside hydrolase family 3 C-terminal domain-containing protein [Fusicatenibacter sp.]|nr:glycoside hydrolase family 3 C-terminal domain-containing protein [Fusicatenibacter sp.]